MGANENSFDIQLFKTTAEALNPAVKNLTQLFNDWQREANSLRGDWQGPASENVRNTAKQVAQSSSDLLKSITQWQAALNQMAGIYEATEKNAQNKAQSLSFKKSSVK